MSKPRRIDVGGLEIRELVGVEQEIEWATLFDVHFKAGSRVPWHIHSYDEVGVAQEGVSEMHVGHEVIRPERGELVVIPAGTPHSGDRPRTSAAPGSGPGHAATRCTTTKTRSS